METDGWQVEALFRVSRALSHRVKGLAAVVSVGLACLRCGHRHDPVHLRTRDLLHCRHCHHQVSLSAGTIFAATKFCR